MRKTCEVYSNIPIQFDEKKYTSISKGLCCYSIFYFLPVWISGGTASTSGYRGVLLQARTVGGNAPVGTWKSTPVYTKRVQCSAANDAVTHSEVANVKNGSTVFEWMPSGNHNNVQFVYVLMLFLYEVIIIDVLEVGLCNFYINPLKT